MSSYLLSGIDALACEVEVDFDDTTASDAPKGVVVGLPDAGVKESIERVKAAVVNSGYAYPRGRLLINLAPADVRKEGPIYDLPIALGLLMVQGVIEDPALRRFTKGAGSKPGGGSKVVTKVNRTASGAVSVSKMREAVEKGAGGAAEARGEEGDELSRAFDEAMARGDVDRGDGGGADEPTAEELLDLRRYLVAGELALDGRVRPVKGVIAMATLARQLGLAGVIVPRENAAEAAVVPGVEAIGVSSLVEAVGMLSGRVAVNVQAPTDVAALLRTSSAEIDFADVRGQESVKRAIVVAAAGGHNIIMLGPAGTGKSMMAKALPGVLPAMTVEEAIEVTRVYSAAGKMEGGQGVVTVRPVRTPHHTASGAAVIGGGMIPRPGEVSLAHRGVLFLDELPEFPRDVLETLRQPLEDHVVTIARSHSAVKFPASFMLVAAMNPTPKGDMPSDEGGRRAMERYLAKLSGPLVDRIDIHVEAPAVPFKQLSGRDGPRGTSSAQMREQVLTARRKQIARQGEGKVNARLSGRELDRLAPMTEAARSILEQAMTELKLSARAYDKIRRVARTIADLEGAETIDIAHVSEAVQYRLLDRRL
ncbi:MAG: YifB family Mg chelatase-like AAA ATPase [Phycisphaerales bacterium]|nr:YifB family Mg chelatase-like AAA ATPase [Phycisphaerales bacterium]